ncbi:MAG: flp3 [Haloplasmataceae bacterium]|jgi:CRP/FNR family transcriptional regulator|nr:flp3 [Haloplasmataceae bacterium]
MSDHKCETCHNELCAKKVPIFEFLSDKELQEIVNMTINKDYKKGDILFHEKDISDTLYIINEGNVKLSKITIEAKEQIVRIVSSGDFFGELNLFTNNQSYNFNATAITDVNVCTLRKANMQKIILKNPEIAIKILTEMSKKLTESENLAQTLATNAAEARIAYVILEFAEKYGVKVKEGIKIISPINREEMANYAGVTRETISRKLKIFEDAEIINLVGSKGIIIKDLDSLKNYVE